LRAEVAAAQATSAQLAQRVGELAQRVRELEDRPPPTKPPGLAGNKLTPAKAPPPRQARKRRAANRARARLVPTAREVHALERCPDCGQPLAGGRVAWAREVSDPRRPRRWR
jgi:hypothetical protein